jgi:CheY-like chemotaxis protein
MRMVAVGVADTGPGFSQKILKSAEASVSNSDSKTRTHGAQNTGFGLYLVHLLAKALNTKLQQTSLEQCRHLLNEDMVKAMVEYQRTSGDVAKDGTSGSSKLASSRNSDEADDLKSGPTRPVTRNSAPGPGTVLYFIIPVYEDGAGARTALRVAAESGLSLSDEDLDISPSKLALALDASQYTFCPRPSSNSANGNFRILVADDVPMLRKGLLHSISILFHDCCPVSVSTACSAEDALRAVASQPFDLFICDHHFNHEDPSRLKPLSPEEEATHGRPCYSYDAKTASRVVVRRLLSEYFENERFTLEESDGSLTGFDALMQLSEARNPPFPTPVLMLLSGHHMEAPPSAGIIIAQKPLRQSEFGPFLEAHALPLLKAGQLVRGDRCDNDGNESENSSVSGSLFNKHRSQMFVRCGEDEVT